MYSFHTCKGLEKFTANLQSPLAPHTAALYGEPMQCLVRQEGNMEGTEAWFDNGASIIVNYEIVIMQRGLESWCDH